MSEDLTPEEDAVRRLLAQARHDEPLPAEVAARLDARLAELQAELRAEDAAPTAGPVLDLGAARRRRRRAPALLAAAAALVVGGVALNTVLDGQGVDSLSAGDAGQAESRDSLTEDGSTYSSEAGAGAESDSGADLKAGQDEAAAPQATAAQTTELSSDAGLRDAVRDLARSLPGERSGSTALGDTAGWPECRLTPLPEGWVEWVLVDERPGAVVLPDPSDGRQRAEVWVCGEASALRTFTFRLG